MGLKELPSVDEVLRHRQLAGLAKQLSAPLLADLARFAIGRVRQELADNAAAARADRAALTARIVRQTAAAAARFLAPNLKRVINGTGIVLHTGLGRAPLPAAAVRNLTRVLAHYSNVEHDLESGKRGRREALVEELLCRLSGAEAAAVVNNNAAAVLLVLNTFGFRKQTVVSRGELVEIGGSFRIPDIMQKSGTRMIEVGTTNRTHLADYEHAISSRTGLLVKVHTSNYRIKGFTAEVPLAGLAQLGSRRGVPVYFDLGSGVLTDLRRWGLPPELTVKECVAAGADILSCSGDKMLGGPQCGIILGKKTFIDAVKRNPLMRVLRCGKLTYAALEPTVRLFLNEAALPETLPVARMLSQTTATLDQRAARMLQGLAGLSAITCEKIDSCAQTGGGALPLETLPSRAVRIAPKTLSPAALLKRLAAAAVPVVGYVQDDRCVLDMLTIRDDEVPLVVRAMRAAVRAPGKAGA